MKPLAARTAQLEMSFSAPARPEPGRVVVTRALRDHPRVNFVLRRVHYVLRFFPELAGKTLRVGLTRVASGMAVPGGNEIWLNPSYASYHTIAHEFIHLLQRTETGIPQGEKSCDVFSMARDWTLNDVPPNYVRIPARLLDVRGSLPPRSAMLVYEAAAEAVVRRQDGLRNYIAFFEKHVLDLTMDALLEDLEQRY